MDVIINEFETLEFPDKDYAIEFLRNERHKWHWLTELPTHLLKAAKEIQTILLDHPVFGAEIALNEQAVFTVNIGTKTEPFITSTSEEGKFINDAASNFSYIVAFFSIIYSNEHIRYIAYNNAIISETLRMQRFDYERTTAINLSLVLGNYEKFMGTRRQSVFQEILREQRNDQKEYRANFNEIAESFKTLVKEHSQQARLHINESQSILHRRIKAINVLSKRGTRNINAAAKSAKETHDAALERLQAADAAYTGQLELKYSVTYWNGRKLAHTLSKYGWLLGVIFSLLLMLSVVGLYFANGGLTTISENLSKRLPSSFLILSDPDKQIEIQSSSLHTAFSKSEVASLATNITGAILLITILSIFIRITLRQFSIHTQYALEASERVTFIKTYLALMLEKQIKSDEDRKLILECIFKSTIGAPASEIAFSLPIDSMMKVLGERKVTS